MKYFEVIKNKDFTYLLLGNFFRRSSFVIFSLQLIWFTMYLTNHSTIKLSIMVMSETLPFVCFGVLGGIVCDRANKKLIIVLSDIVLSIIIFLIPLLYILKLLDYTILLVISIVITLINCFTDPAFRSILPEIVNKKDLSSSNALIDSVQRGSGIIFPALIGFLVFHVGDVGVFTICSILLCLGFICNCFVTYVVKDVSKDQSKVSNDLKIAWEFLKESPQIYFIIVVQFICILVNTGIWRVALPLYITQVLDKGIELYGITTTLLCISSLVMSLAIGILSERRLILKFSIGVFIWGIGIFLLGAFPSSIILYCASILIGIGQSIEGLVRSITIQINTPKHLMGKVFSLSATSNYTADTLSLSIIGLILPFISLGSTFLIAGMLISIMSIVGIKYVLKENKQL